MSNYYNLPGTDLREEDKNNEPSYHVPKFESFQLQKDKELMPYEEKFKKWCFILIGLAVVYPIAAWFTEEQRVLFYQSLGFFLGQVLLALFGLRALKQNVARRLESYTKYIHIYFLLLLAGLIANQVILTSTVTSHNDDNCSDFKYNKVCSGRWGLMADQLVLILFFPSIDMAVFIIYRYFLQTTNEFMKVLNNRNV